MSMSNYLENKVLDHVLKNTTYTPPATVYVALYTTDPTDADTGTEVTGGSYARQPIAFNAAVNGASANSAMITFPAATADWGTITHIGLRDALTNGNLLWSGALTVAKQILNTDQFALNAGQVTATLD